MASEMHIHMAPESVTPAPSAAPPPSAAVAAANTTSTGTTLLGLLALVLLACVAAWVLGGTDPPMEVVPTVHRPAAASPATPSVRAERPLKRSRSRKVRVPELFPRRPPRSRPAH